MPIRIISFDIYFSARTEIIDEAVALKAIGHMMRECMSGLGRNQMNTHTHTHYPIHTINKTKQYKHKYGR